MSGVGRAAAAAAGLLLACGARADAQRPEEWRFGVTPYFWMAGVDGNVGVGSLSTRVDLSASDRLDNLQGVAMVYGEARVRHWVMGLDAVYLSVGPGPAFAASGATGTFLLQQKQTIIQPTAGYTFVFYDGFTVDALVGARYWNVDHTLDLSGADQASRTQSDTRQWLDATAGLRATWWPFDRLQIAAGEDGGGGGSRSSWNAYGGASAVVTSWLSLGVWYRSLDVNYDRDNMLFDTNTQGLGLSLTLSF